MKHSVTWKSVTWPDILDECTMYLGLGRVVARLATRVAGSRGVSVRGRFPRVARGLNSHSGCPWNILPSRGRLPSFAQAADSTEHETARSSCPPLDEDYPGSFVKKISTL